MPPVHHDHDDGGLAQDLLRIDASLARRKLLRFFLAGGIAAADSSCGGSSDESASSASGTSSTSSSGSSSASGTVSQTTTTTSSACITDPVETNGPFPADGTNTVNGATVNVLTQSGIVRSDITSSFGSSSTTAPGVPLTLIINLENTEDSCALLLDYAIYIWHCDRDGEYSLYASDLLDENYLRGVQVTDSNGQVTFDTIFPACYSGRYPHIHVEVYASLSAATGQKNAILTTQLAMPRDICSTVYGSADGYSSSVSNLSQVTTSSDNVFDASTAAELAAQTPSILGSVSTGYTATVTIGVATAST